MQNTLFNSNTETIIQVLSANDKIIDCLPSIPRREKTQRFIGNIYDDIHWGCSMVYSAKKKHDSSRHIIETRRIHNQNEIPKPNRLSMSSIPKDVSEYIYNNSSYLFHFSTRVKNRLVKVNFVTTHRDPASHIDTYTQYFERMMVWFHIAFKYSSDTCGSNISIYIYDTPLQKILPTNRNEIVGISHANTAYTYACPVEHKHSNRIMTRGVVSSIESEIILFRKEEWFKVFIHETFHMLGLDFAGMHNIDTARNVIREKFPLESDMEIFEAYTETWATIINTCFCSYFCLKQMGKVTFVSYVEVLLGFEAAWRIFQMHKILQFMGLIYSDLYMNTKKAQLARSNLYRENTNVFAYYILSSILLVNYGDFLEWCSVNNGVSGNMSFHKTSANTVAFANFIVGLTENTASKTNIKNIGSKKCFNMILKSSTIPEYRKWISKTMRMTVCEMS